MKKDPALCQICEGALKETDLEAVCLACYRKARSPRDPVVLAMTEEDKAHFGMAFAFGGFLMAGLQVLSEWAEARGPKPRKPEPPLSTAEVKRRILEALKRDMARLDRQGPGKPPGPKAR